MDIEEKEALSKIAKILIVRKALDVIIFDKLLHDGYVCCINGLYPSNKSALHSTLKNKNSPLFSIIDKNSNTYKEILDKLAYLNIDDSYKLSFEESQSIVYSILVINSNEPKTDIIFFLFHEIYGETRFYQNGYFIMDKETKLYNIDSVASFIEVLEKLEDSDKPINMLFRGHNNIIANDIKNLT